jgi:hypothetical protein
LIHQLSWKILPGLRGLSCSEFSATPTSAPDNDRGVTVELSGPAESEALVALLEAHFAPQHFSNSAAAFETVKTFVLEWVGRRS